MTTTNPIVFLQPAWACPAAVRVVISTRIGGHSSGVYQGANLAEHVGDDPAAVAANRRQLTDQTGMSQWPWLQQVHGTTVVQAPIGGCGPVADGIYSRTPGEVCAVLTADCLPVLLCDARGREVAAVHAGWRGLAAGVIEQALKCFDAPGAEIFAYLGPAIGPRHFEVGPEVREVFAQRFTTLGIDNDWFGCFAPAAREGYYHADLYRLARHLLGAAQVTQVFGGTYCTHADVEHFYSYRRDGDTGRMISAIWLDPHLSASA